MDTNRIEAAIANIKALESQLVAAHEELRDAANQPIPYTVNDKPTIVSPGPAPRKTRERRSIRDSGEPPPESSVAPNPVTGRTRKARTVLQPGERRQRPISEAALEAVREALANGNHDSVSITEASKLTKPNALLALGRLVEAGEAVKTGTTKDARWTLVTAPVAQAEAE